MRVPALVQGTFLDDEASLPNLAQGLNAIHLKRVLQKTLLRHLSMPDTFSKNQRTPTLTAEAESEFRQIMSVEGWEFGEHDNLEMTYDPCTKSAFIFAAGDHYTGLIDSHRLPRCKSNKGNATKAVVQLNSRQISLLDDSEKNEKPYPFSGEIKHVYYILYHIQGDVIKSGVYKPLVYKSRQISDWSEYYILSPISTGGKMHINRKQKLKANPLATESLDIPVTRKKK